MNDFERFFASLLILQVIWLATLIGLGVVGDLRTGRCCDWVTTTPSRHHALP